MTFIILELVSKDFATFKPLAMCSRILIASVFRPRLTRKPMNNYNYAKKNNFKFQFMNYNQMAREPEIKIVI